MARASKQATPGVDTQGPRPHARFGPTSKAKSLGMPLMGPVRNPRNSGGMAAPTHRPGNMAGDQRMGHKVTPNPSGWGRKAHWNGGGTPGVGTPAPSKNARFGSVAPKAVSKQSYKPMPAIQRTSGRAR